MTLVRSSPVMVMLPGWRFCPACTSTLVSTPSNSGCGRPPRVTISTTRSGGVPRLVLLPTAIRNRVFSSDLLLTLKRSWKPLAPSLALVTVTSSRASISMAGTGSGMIGPISRLRCTALLMSPLLARLPAR